MPLSKNDAAFVKLFKWALVTYEVVQGKPHDKSPSGLTHLLSCEGTWGILHISEVQGQLPAHLNDSLRAFRKLSQYNRLDKVQRLQKEWST